MAGRWPHASELYAREAKAQALREGEDENLAQAVYEAAERYAQQNPSAPDVTAAARRYAEVFR